MEEEVDDDPFLEPNPTSLFLDTGLELAEDLLEAMKHIRLDWHNQHLIGESGRLREDGDLTRIHNLMSELNNHVFEMEVCLGRERRHRVVMNNTIPRRPKRTRHQFKIHINNKSQGVILHTQMRIDEPWQDIIQQIYRSFASDDLYTIINWKENEQNVKTFVRGADTLSSLGLWNGGIVTVCDDKSNSVIYDASEAEFKVKVNHFVTMSNRSWTIEIVQPNQYYFNL